MIPMTKQMYLNFIMTLSCRLNCSYCIIPEEKRKSVEFLTIKTYKLKLFQAMKFFKDNNYDSLIISITGDELDRIPGFLDFLEEALQYTEKVCGFIPKENIKLKMHTNINGKEPFYEKQFQMMQDAKRFSTPEFETVYQAMYHSSKRRKKQEWIKDKLNELGVNYLSSLGLQNESEKPFVEHVYHDLMFDFSNMKPQPKFTDREMMYLVISPDGAVTSGCGFGVIENMFKMQDDDFCSNCPHESCVMMNDLNKL